MKSRGIGVAIAGLAGVLLVAGWASGQEDARAGVRKYINDQMDGMRLQAQSRYATPGMQRLPVKKETGDSCFLPILLIEELSAPDAKDWCRVLRYNYTSDVPLRAENGLPPAGDWAKLFAPFRLDERRHAQFSLRMRRYVYAGGLWPVTLWADVVVAPSGATMRFRGYEPGLANLDLGFSLHPEGLTVLWTPQVMRFYQYYRTQPMTDAPRRMATAKDFSMPSPVYTVGDTLNLALQSGATTPDPQPPAAGAEGGMRVTLRLPDGTPLRSTEIESRDGRLQAIRIRQEPVTLTHRDFITYQVRKDDGGGAPTTETMQASRRMTWLEGGRDVEIAFRDGPGGPVPERLRIAREGVTVFEAVYSRFQYLPPDQVTVVAGAPYPAEETEVVARLKEVYTAIDGKGKDWTPKYYSDAETSAQVDPYVLRLRLKHNAFAAMQRADYPRLDDALHRYREMLAREGLGNDVFAFNVEALTQMAFDFLGDDAGAALSERVLRKAYEKCDTRELLAQAVRLMDQYRFGYALIALRVLGERKDLAGAYREWLPEAEKRLRALIAAPDTTEGQYLNARFTQCSKASRVIAARLTPAGQ